VTAGEAGAGLGGTGRLADDLYLVAHNDVSGRAHLQPRALGLGLAGALLAELMLAGQLGVRRDGIVAVVTGSGAPADWLAGLIRGQVAAEREPHGLRDWLLFLGGTATGKVPRRLEQAGYLTCVPVRWPRRGVRWVPVDRDCAFAPLLRARSALDPSRPVPVTAAALAGLADACGLGQLLLQYAPPGACHPEQAAGQLHPAMRDLIAQTRAAVDSALLAHRV
jgi:hypothetical protein